MDGKIVEERLMAAASDRSKAVLDSALEALREISSSGDAAGLHDALNLLWESWADEEMDGRMAEFILECARLRLPEGPAFRPLFGAAVKELLPPYLSKIGVIRAIGARENTVPLADAVRRFDRIKTLKNGQKVFLMETGRWGTLNSIDPMSANAAIALYDGGAHSLPLDKALTDCLYFQFNMDSAKLLDRTKLARLSAADFRTIVQKTAAFKISDALLRSFAERLMVPAAMPRTKFEEWFNNAPADSGAATTAAAKRTAGHARSLKEMDLLLDAELAAKASPIDVAERDAYRDFFARLKADIAVRDAKLLATVLAKIAERVAPEHWGAILEPLKGKAAFWPADPQKCNLEMLTAWGDLPVKLLEKLAAITASAFDPQYLALLAVKLPLRSLNVFCPALDPALRDQIFGSVREMSSDLLLWIWKNRKLCAPDLLELVNLENVVNALAVLNLPKDWLVAQRELKTCLIDRKDFQAHMVEVFEGEEERLTGAIAGAMVLDAGERQSLLVKLANYSEALQKLLESGIGSQVLGGAAEDANASDPDEPVYTSLASHRRMVQELDNIINVQQPENREALKTARAHGDFRENAEFDAAKERRNFLTRRRNELERDINAVQQLDFRTVKPAAFADIGSAITLRYEDNGAEEVFYLLGAWDGNPDKHYLSYKTRLGEVIRNRETGAELTLPDGRKATLTKIEALPESVLADMD